MTVVRSVDGRFTASWAATDNIGIARYQWRTRQRPGRHHVRVTTTHDPRCGRSGFGTGTWELDVRARDAVGNWSAWRSVRVIVPARRSRVQRSRPATTRRDERGGVSGHPHHDQRQGRARSRSRRRTATGSSWSAESGRHTDAAGHRRRRVDDRRHGVLQGQACDARITTACCCSRRGSRAGAHTVTITNLGTPAARRSRSMGSTSRADRSSRTEELAARDIDISPLRQHILLGMRTLAMGVAAVALVAACTAGPATQATDLTIFAAASLKGALDKAKPAYEDEPSADLTLTVSTDSSSALETQIEQGAPADVFLSADTTNPTKLVEWRVRRAAMPVDFARQRADDHRSGRQPGRRRQRRPIWRGAA